MRLRSDVVRRDFRLVIADSACHHFGSAGEQVLFGLMVYELTGSSAWVGIAYALYFGPMLLFGAPSGALADALDRRRLLPVIELCVSANLAVFAVVITLGLASLWPVLVLTTVSGSLRATYHPVRSSYVYDLVGGNAVVAAFGWLNLSMRAGQLIGALAAGGLMQQFGAEYAYATMFTAHVGAAALTLRLRTSSAPTRGSIHAPWSALSHTLRELGVEMRKNRTLLMLVVVTASVEIFGFSFVTALPELVVSLDGGPQSLGTLHAARAGGGLLAGAALVAVGARLKRRGAWYLLLVYLFGIGLWLVAAAPTLVLAGSALALVAFTAASIDVLGQSMMQLCVPDRLRGRAMGAWVFAAGTAPLGHLEIGALVAALGASMALGINGVCLIAIGLMATVAAPHLRAR